MKSGPEGNYSWVKKEKIWEYLKNPVKEIKEILTLIDAKEITFGEGNYITDGF